MNHKEPYRLMNEGAEIFATVEMNGIRVDNTKLDGILDDIKNRISKLHVKLERYPEVKDWKREYSAKFNIDSPAQLSDILYNRMGIEIRKKTATGKGSVDMEVLEGLDIPFIKVLLKIRKLNKIKSTYLMNILRETCDGMLHPFFNLHTVKTYRSSSSNPNWQNIPKRDKESMKLIRSLIIPREGYRIGGVDYKGVEVRIAACYCQDKELIRYVNNPELDMHRDMAMECFLLDRDQVTKTIRYCGKNMFVFPQFYGDYFKNCATNLWKAIPELKLKTVDGTSLKNHLKEQGITSYNKFERHIEDVENRFWYEKFDEYRKWKKKWYKQYLKKGSFEMFTGFKCAGDMSRNDVSNYPIQGTAFHCLLWSLIEIQKWFKKEKFQSVIVGQIHDEITLDLHADEFDYVLIGIRKIMCDDIRDYYDWMIVPLDIDAEFGKVNESWDMKEKVEIGD